MSLFDDDVKACHKCGVVKPLEDFDRDRSKKSGRDGSCKACAAEYNRTPDRQRSSRAARLMREYGLTLGEFEAMYRAQAGRCAICKVFKAAHAAGVAQGKATHECLNVDHADVDGRPVPIALLCSPCNTAIGLLKYAQDVLPRLADYLILRESRIRAATDSPLMAAA